ncbi:MAG: rhodanese-like domain-containing protein [Verrucomicrobia bacterium]|nr:rhodanese-like domain-containing protein [Verrucomicrobiota bacterium]MDA1088140.1 rhodanese-like domain-containing protein [Verrucomicrobiota bacterium]
MYRDVLHCFAPRFGMVVPLALILVGASGCGSGQESRKEQINTLYEKHRKAFRETPELSADAALALQRRGQAVFVDVREEKEQVVSMIAGAITKKEFERAPERYTNRVVIAYCTIGARSGEYAATKIKHGIAVSNLRGSILSWIHAGGSITNGGGTTTNVHVYGPRWNLVPDGYHAIW